MIETNELLIIVEKLLGNPNNIILRTALLFYIYKHEILVKTLNNKDKYLVENYDRFLNDYYKFCEAKT